MTTSNLQLKEFGSVGVPSGDDLTTNMRRLDTVVQLAVIGFAATPPASPLPGDRYIVDVSPTEAFAGHQRHIAVYGASGWTFLVPENGWFALVGDSPPIPYTFDLPSATWVAMQAYASATTDINLSMPFYAAGAPTASQILMQFVAPATWTIPPNFGASYGHVGTNPTATWTALVKLNGSNIGTIVVTTAGIFSFTTASGLPVALVAGDTIQVTAPSGTDATIADISCTLLANVQVSVSTMNQWDGALFFPGTPTNNQLLAKLIAGVNFTLPANLVNSKGHAGTNPAGTWTSNLSINGADVGSVICSTGGVFTFSTVSGENIDVLAGSRIEWEGPASADASIANISLTLLAVLA